MTLTRSSIRRAGLSMVDLARLSNISYTRTWRALAGGSITHLSPDELARMHRVIAEAFVQAELAG